MKTQSLHKLLAALAVAGLILSACAPPTTPAAAPTSATAATKPAAATSAPAATEAPAEHVKLVYWAWGSEDMKFPDGDLLGDWYRKDVIQPFMDANPNIEIEFDMKGYESSGTTLYIDTAVAAGEPPDLFFDSIFRVAKFAHKGLMMDLDSIMTPEKVAGLDPSYVPTAQRNGHTWGIVIDNSFPDAMVLNKKTFEAAGALDLLPKEPDRDWTTEDFEKACAAVTNAPDLYCTLFWAKTPSYDHATTLAWLTAWGCELFKPGDYSKVAINSPQCIEGLKWMQSMIEKGYIVPGAAGLVDDDLDQYLISGRIALAAGGWYELGLVQSGQKDGSLTVDFEPYMVNYPHLPGQKPGKLANLGGRVIAAFKGKDSNPARDAAILKFIDWVTTPEMMTKTVKKAAGGLAGFPLLAKVNMDELFPGNQDFAWIVRMQTERGVTDYGWTANNFSQLRPLWAETRQAIWSEDISIEQGLADFEKKANELLNSPP